MLTNKSFRRLAEVMDLPNVLKESTLQEDLIDFLSDNPNPPDDEVHEWAERNGYEVDDIEEEIYKFATLYIDFLTGGKFNESDLGEEDVDPEELRMGIEVEMEHTLDRNTAKRIALDHLLEIPDYYTRLKKMETASKKDSYRHPVR